MGAKSSLAFPDDDALRGVRNWLAHHPRADLNELGDLLLAQLGRSPKWREVAAVLELLGPRSPGGAPAFLAEFIAELAAARSAAAVLDPFSTSPTLIAALDERLPAGRAVALAPDHSVDRLGRLVAPRVDWRVGMPPDTLPQLDGSFDFIASTPPLGMKHGSSVSIRPGLGDYANSLMVDAADRLLVGGALAFLVADGFFFRADAQRTLEALHSRGLRMEAAISIEGGLRPTSEVPTSLVLITHGEPLEDLFVGRLDSVIDPAVLIQNMIERKHGEFLQLGVLYRAGRYRGWQALLSERELLVGLGDVRAPIVELGQIALEFTRLPDDDAEPVNSIYMPEFPRSPVLVEPPEKPKGYTRIDLDSERATARWVATWFNEPLGRAARRALTTGAVIERVRSADLRRLLVAVPPVEEQGHAVNLAQELQLIASEIADTRAGLWAGTLVVGSAEEFLGRVRGAFPQETDQFPAAPTVEGWIEQLPFPLASIGRRYLAVAPMREKVDHLQHFFEAYAIFFSTILFSAVRRERATYEDTIAKIRGGSESRRSILDRADFHTWINLGRTIAKRIRGRLSADKSGEISTSLFGRLPESFVDVLVEAEYWRALDAARLVRNERGHGGIESDRWLKGKLSRLESTLNDLRLVAPHAFAVVDLVRPGSAEQGHDDLFTFDRAERLMSSNMMFEERELKSTASMRGRGLYLVPAGGIAENPLQLMPLIQLRQVPEGEDRAVYYYNRRLTPDEGPGFRFVSYHFEGRPEEQVEDSDLASLIEDLTPE